MVWRSWMFIFNLGTQVSMIINKHYCGTVYWLLRLKGNLFSHHLGFERRENLEMKLGALVCYGQQQGGPWQKSTPNGEELGTRIGNHAHSRASFSFLNCFLFKCLLLTLFSMKILTICKENISMADLIMSASNNRCNLYTQAFRSSDKQSYLFKSNK